jgi:hypothetical protein
MAQWKRASLRRKRSWVRSLLDSDAIFLCTFEVELFLAPGGGTLDTIPSEVRNASMNTPALVASQVHEYMGEPHFQ